MCRLFSGQRSKRLSSYLELLGFDPDLRANLDAQTITPVGISRLIEYPRPITDRTRFLYFCYRQRQDKIQVKGQKADRVIPPPTTSATATHAITKIIWGIEFVIVVAISADSSIERVDELLRKLQSLLRQWQEPIKLTKEESRLLSTLDNTAVYGTETCIENLMMPISTILASVRDWQANPEFLQPVEYIMQPLRWLYGDRQFQARPAVKPTDPHLKRIPALLQRIDGQIEDLGRIFEQLPKAFPSVTLNHTLGQERQYYQYLLDTYEVFTNRLRKIEADVRQERVSSSEVDAVISHKNFQCLGREKLAEKHTTAQRLLSKVKLIERLNHDRVEYANAVDIYPRGKVPNTRLDQVDEAIREHFADREHDVILLYSVDRLRREQADRWDRYYRQLISEGSNRRIALHYVDFSDVTPVLNDFDIIHLPRRASASHPSLNTPTRDTRPFGQFEL